MSALAAADGVTLSAPQYWCRDHDDPIPADVNGDGLCDIISQDGDDGGLYVSITSKYGKPLPLLKMSRRLSGPSIAGVAGRITGSAGDDALFILTDGRVQLAYGALPGDSQYRQIDTVASVPANELPAQPVFLVRGDFAGDGRVDAVLAGSDGRLVLLHNVSPQSGPPLFIAVAIEGSLGAGVSQVASARVAGDSRARLIWLTDDGKVMRSVLVQKLGVSAGWKLAPPYTITTADPDSKMVAGRFTGSLVDDLIVGQSLLVAADPARRITLTNVPSLSESRFDTEWCEGDIDGNGKDDLICKRSPDLKSGASRIDILFASSADDKEKGFVKSVPDGLLDAWKLGGPMPGGLDLKALGCKVGHRDLVVEVERFAGTDDKALKAQMQHAVDYFASLPIDNPDGATGIALHLIYPPQIPAAQRDFDEAHFDDVFPPKELRGVVHCMVDDGKELAALGGDSGHFDGKWLIFAHEIGHNMGLTHEGGWDRDFSALYPSLMNYAYSGVLFPVKNPGYSHGALGSFSLDETHMSKLVPVPIQTAAYFGESPYSFHIKPSPDGKGTLVDWDWNGDFDEQNVSADICYLPHMSVGDLHVIGSAQTAPALVAAGAGSDQRLAVIYGRSASASPGGATLSQAHPGLLALRSWRGHGVDSDGADWSSEAILAASGVTGDPSACAEGDDIWVAYPTRLGAYVIHVLFQGDTPVVERAERVPFSLGAIPTIVSVGGQVELLLWRSPSSTVGVRTVAQAPDGWSIGLETQLGIYSLGPVAATPGPDSGGQPSLIVGGLNANNSAGHPWFRSYYYALQGRSLVAQSAAWQSELMSPIWMPLRPVMLWEQYPGLNPNGRLYTLTSVNRDDWCYLMMSTAYPNDDDGVRLSHGWLARSIEEPSRSGAGACFFRGDIAFATRREGSGSGGGDNDLEVAFHGRGIFPGRQGDFDDIGQISNYGLDSSIGSVAE